MNNSESSQKLKIGDVVQLKSNGPSMTVANTEKSGKIYCQWFVFVVEHYEAREGYFSPDSLQLVVK